MAAVTIRTVKRLGCSGQWREEVFNFRQIGQRPDIEGQVHELHEDKERLHDWIRDLRKLLRGGQNPAKEPRLCLRRDCLLSSWHICAAPELRRPGARRLMRRSFTRCDAFDRSDEAIAAAGQGLNESGIARRISEGLADAIHRRVYAVLVVDEGAVGPQLPGDFLAGEQLAGPVQQQQKHLKGLRIQLDADALPAQLSGGGVGFECSEAIAPGWLRVCHVFSPVYPIENSIQSEPRKSTTSQKSQLLQSLAE